MYPLILQTLELVGMMMQTYTDVEAHGERLLGYINEADTTPETSRCYHWTVRKIIIDKIEKIQKRIDRDTAAGRRSFDDTTPLDLVLHYCKACYVIAEAKYPR